jgi:hypothetical protein
MNLDFDSEPGAINERVCSRDVAHSRSSTQPMHPSQSRAIYYAVKGGRDGDTVCTSWEDVRAVST